MAKRPKLKSHKDQRKHSDETLRRSKKASDLRSYLDQKLEQLNKKKG